MQSPEEELKRLLLAPELNLLDTLAEHIADLQGRVGDDAALEASTRRVIVNVLRDAGAEEHDRLSMILAPLMLASLRAEIRGSREMMVEALYPLTGRLVSAAVKNAFRDLLQTFDSKMTETFSLAHLRVRIEALLTRRPVGELMLQRFPPFSITEILVIHRPTGLLIGRTGDDDDEDGIDRDLVGSMLNAVMSLTKDAFGDQNSGELSTLEFGESQLFVKSSPTLVVVVATTGVAPGSFDATLEDTFVRFLDVWGSVLSEFDGELDPQEDIELTGDLNRRAHELAVEALRTESVSLKRPGTVLATVLILLLSWVGFRVANSVVDSRVESAARETVDNQALLAGYPIQVQFDRGRAVLHVTGLAPDVATRDALAAALATAIDVDVDFNVHALPAPRREEVDPVEDVLHFVSQNAIYFSEGSEPRAPAQTEQTLVELARLLNATPPHVRMRVIGYADPLGSAGINEALTLRRARFVADRLIALGVAPQRLSTVGRPGERLLTQTVGVSSDSRRAEFEVYFTER